MKGDAVLQIEAWLTVKDSETRGSVYDRTFTDRMLGSTAAEVTKRAECDVLVVRPVKAEGDLEVGEDASALADG